MFIYIFTYLLLLVGSYTSRRSIFLLYVILALFAFFVGFRAETVGVDTPAYQDLYISLGEYGYKGYPEPIYGYLCEFSNRLGVSFSLFQSILMYIALCMTALAIRHESNNYCLSMFLMVSMYFICYAMNIYRQTLACLIVVYACSALINDNKKWKFSLWIFIAAGFHLVALIMFSALILEKLKLGKNSIYIGLIFTMTIGLINILNILSPILGEYGALYIDSRGDEYTKTGMRLILAIFLSIYWTAGFFFLYKHANKEFRESLYLKLFFVGILFYNLLISHDLGLRISMFFFFPMIVGLPLFVKSSNMKWLKSQALIVSYTSFYFFMLLAMNSAGVVPYELTGD